MKTVLVMSTAFDKSIPQTKWQQPLGISYIAACIRDISDVSIIDCEVDDKYTKTLINELDTDDQLVVGFSSNTYSYPGAIRLAKLVKEHNPNAHINFGGYHVTPLANLVLKNRIYIDSVIRGDGEVPFRQLLLALSNGNDLSNVGSLTYRKNNEIISNPKAPLPDLDSLPYPARDLLPMETYFDNLKKSHFSKIYNSSRMVFINATRGCPNHCNYCSIFNKNLRIRKPESIVDEFDYAIKNYGSDIIYLIGDNLNYNSKWLLSICEEIIKRKIDIKWMGITFNPQNLDKNLVDAMKRSGCFCVFCGFESASKEVLKLMNRKYLPDTFMRNANILRGGELINCASFILGSSGESEETLRATIEFAKKSNFDRIFASVISPLPGSDVYNKTCEIMPELREMDIIPIEEAKRLYIEKYCSVNYQRLIEAREELKSTPQTMEFDLY